VDELRDRLEAWRRSRQKGRRIPEALWSAAVGLVWVHDLNPIARALRLNYYSLKRRDEAAEAQAAGDDGASSGFVELEVGHAPLGEECRIELSDDAGGKMTVTIRGSCSRDLDLKGIVAGFLARSR
jgi:hypothetical protein